MTKENIFLSQQGVTCTQASRVADFAKLQYTEFEGELEGLKFYSEGIETIDGDDAKVLSLGRTNLDKLDESIDKMGRLKALCAWLREAVKAHESLELKASSYSFDNYLKEFGLEEPVQPSLPIFLTEDDVLAMFDVKKLNRYLYLKAMAGAYGDCVHKGMPIDKARKDFYKKVANPREERVLGNIVYIRSFEPSVSAKELDETFYMLQGKQTRYQQEFNQIKSEIQSRINNDRIDKTSAYALSNNEYEAKKSKLYAEYQAYKTKKEKEAAALKIVIPNEIKGIYDEVLELTKPEK